MTLATVPILPVSNAVPPLHVEQAQPSGQAQPSAQAQQPAQGQPAPVVDREALRENIRRTVDQALRTNDQALQAAQEAARARGQGVVVVGQELPVPPAVPGQGTTRVVVDGRNAIPPEVTDITMMFFLMIAAIAILRPIMNAFGRRLERKAMPPAALPMETAQQIARIEQTVEAMAIEIERISEGQRFAAKLLAEREREKLPG